MTQAQKQTMYAEIEKHGNNLNKIFNTRLDPVKLCKKLRKLELKAAKLAEDYANGENGVTTDNIREKELPIMKEVYKILNNGIYNDDRPHMKKVPVFFNTDPRGYALKINDAYVKLLEINGKSIFKDWGGYGIIAPDFSPNN